MNQKEGKERILKAAYKLILEREEPKKVTVKDIAEQAGVGVGLINYHFKNKEYLMMEAVGAAMAEVAGGWQKMAESPLEDPKLMLKQMLMELIEMGARYRFLTEIAAKFELIEGPFHTPEFILPYVRQITGLDEQPARIKTLSLTTCMQAASLGNERFKGYAGLDLEQPSDRMTFVDTLIENL